MISAPAGVDEPDLLAENSVAQFTSTNLWLGLRTLLLTELK
jgi:hypothetical protein